MASTLPHWYVLSIFVISTSPPSPPFLLKNLRAKFNLTLKNPAWHASSGLALQILERQADIPAAIGPLAFTRAQTTCDEWNAWRDKQAKNWTATHQDDSGI